MSKILFDIGSLCTKFNYLGLRPIMISSSTECEIDFSQKGSTLKFYAEFPNCTADLPYGENTFYSRNKIINTDKYSDFFGYCFKKIISNPSEDSVIVLTPPVNYQNFGNKTAEILFETYNISHLSLMPQSVFASKHKHFVSVLFGFSDTYVISHVDCKPCLNSVRHIPIGGHQITEFICSSLREKSFNQEIEEDKFMWLAEHVKFIDRYAFFDSDISYEDFKHSTPDKKSFILDPITNTKEIFAYGYERYLGTAIALYPGNIDPTIKYSLSEFIEDSIFTAIKETNSKSSMERHLKNKISLVGGPASARGIKYKLKNVFKSKKTKKKKSHKNGNKEQKVDDNKNDIDEKDSNEKDSNKDEHQKSPDEAYLKDPTTQLFRNATNYIENTGGVFITNKDYKENGSDSLNLFYL